MDRKRHLLRQITLDDVYLRLEESDIYKKLSAIGDEIYPATQYGNAFVIETDPVGTAYMRVIQVGYVLGVASFMQLEHTLHFVKGSNVEYGVAITFRSMVELVGHVHKAVRLLQEKSRDEFVEQSARLTKAFIPGGGGGFNVLTFVNSLRDQIPDVMEKYEDMSKYVHGDVFLHYLYRRTSFFAQQVHIPVGATEEEAVEALANLRPSPVYQMYEELLEDLRTVLLSDLAVVQAVAAPFSRRYLEHVIEKDGNADDDPA